MILHVSAGWEETNGAAVIGRLIAEEQRSRGEEVRFATWASVSELRAADEVWIHCGWKPCLLWANLWAKRAVRVPEACYDPVRLGYHGWKKRLAGPVERWALRRSAKVIATCPAERDWIARYEPHARVEVTDVKRFFELAASSVAAPSARPHVLYLGRRHPLKGVGYLESACAEVGGLELRVVSGAVGAEKERVWEWCDVLVLPTLSDNFGLVVAEALARGKRVVVTDGAPAWEPADGAATDFGGRLVYVRGFRGGSAAARIALLVSALRRLAL